MNRTEFIKAVAETTERTQKEIKEVLNKCREILCSLIKRLHKGMMSILKLINVFDIIPIEISARFKQKLF